MTDELFQLIYSILEHINLNSPRTLTEIYVALSDTIINKPASDISGLQPLVQYMVECDMLKNTASAEAPSYDLTKEGRVMYYRAKKMLEKESSLKHYTLQLHPHKDYEERSRHFSAAYNFLTALMPLDEVPAKMTSAPKVCRFCGKNSSQVAFKKRAHLIPESLGNKTILSDFECDDCNRFFGNGCDSHLALYLGIQRTLSRTKAKEGIPSYNSYGNEISAKSGSILDEPAIILSRKDVNNQTITADTAKGQIRIQYIKHPHQRLMVYKACLKMALSALPSTEIPSYQQAIKLLMSPEKILHTGCFMNGYHINSPVSITPHIFIFEKKDPAAHIPSHLAALYFSNTIMAIPIPLHLNDMKKWRADPNIELPLYPPLFTEFPNDHELSITAFQGDFSSDETVIDDRQEIRMQIDQSDLKNLVGLNQDGEATTLSFGDFPIKKITLTNFSAPIGSSLIKELLSQK